MPEQKDIKKHLLQLRCDLGLHQITPCSVEEIRDYQNLLKEGKPLPKNVTKDHIYGYLKRVEAGLTEEEKKEYLLLMQTKDIRTITKCMIFLTVVTIISLAGTLLYFLLFLP